MVKPSFSRPLSLACCLVGSLLQFSSASAQVTPDRTTSTTVNQDGNNFEINNGDRSGSNLFHSFQDFSVPTNGEAFFNNASDISNILSRVTGGNISNIDGLIRANGSANLFLINPAGIIFGENATLNIGGSFYGSTADSIIFPDGVFSATDTQGAPLLTINAPIGLGFRDNPNPIVNRSVAEPFGFISGLSSFGNITLVGGDINLENGAISAPGARVELGGLAEAGEIGIETDGSLSFPDNVARSNISLTNSFITVSLGGGGDIVFNANNVDLDNSNLLAGISDGFGGGNAVAGDIIINATDTVSISNGANGTGVFNFVAFSDPTTEGTGGNIEINTGNLSITELAQIKASTFGTGDAGNIIINATDTVSLADADPSTFSFSAILNFVEGSGTGNAGNIEINTANLALSDLAQISAVTFGTGNGGDIIINASDTVSLDGATSDGSFITGIFNTVFMTGVGNGGNVEISTENFSITNGARIIALTENQGNTGNITINATDSVSIDGAVSGIFNTVGGDRLANNINTEGDGGNIEIDTNFFSISGGSIISASTFANGDGGSVIIDAAERVTLDGVSSNEQFRTLVFSTVEASGMGDGGNVEINTNSLEITNGAVAFTSTFGTGDAGDVTINASDRVTLDGSGVALDSDGEPETVGSVIVTRVQPDAIGNGGNITINTGVLNLTNGGSLTAAVDGNGNAGDITIEATDVFVNGLRDDGLSPSGIDTRVSPGGRGEGGEIQITTGNLTVSDGGQLISGTFGQGNAGNIIIDATGSVVFDGVNDNVNISGIIERNQPEIDPFFFENETRLRSVAESTIGEDGVGDGGSIEITADSLTIANEALLVVNNNGQGNTGNIRVDVNSLELTGAGGILAESTFGVGGNIDLDIEDNLILRDNSLISAEATQMANGGNIDIDANFIIAFPAQNDGNDIIASADEEGMGGRITIDAEGIFGIQVRPQSDRTNDIDASGGVDGEVIINTPDVDVSQGLVEAPQNVVEPEQTTAQACQRDGLARSPSSLIIKGKGGVAPEPIEPLNSDAILVDGQLTTPNPQVQSLNIKPIKTSVGDIFPARGIIKTEDGRVILTAYPTDNINTRTPNIRANCTQS